MALKRKIAHINLTDGDVLIKAVPMDWRRRFLGGRGMNAYLLYRYMVPECDPLSPDNIIIISSGLLGGTLVAGMTHTGFAFKSPLTNCVEYSALDGSFASEMRWAGFDYIMIQGRSKNPVNLIIHNQKVDIPEAGKLWGQKTSDTLEQIRKGRLDKESRMFCIGPAGENLVRYANITDDTGMTTGRTGLGAVFGSKQIKSVLCRGTLDIEIKHPEAAIEWQKKLGNLCPNKKDAIKCGKEESNDQISMKWVREYGMDFEIVQAMLAWMTTLGQKKVITDRYTKGLGSDPKIVMKLMTEKIAFRKGFCNILADGPLRASESLNLETIKYFGTIERLLGIYRRKTPDSMTGKGHPNMDDESVKMIFNGLGLSFSGGLGLREKFDLNILKKLIRLNTGLIFSQDDLKKIGVRSRAVERLLSIRENQASKNFSLSNFCFEYPEDAVIPESILHGIELKKYKMKINEHYRVNRWDKKSLLKLKIFKNLGIDDLWPLRQPV